MPSSGDSTAGPIWRNSLSPDQPALGGFQTSTNFPYGESLYSPINLASSFQSVFMNAATKIVGPVCAYNTYNILGYLSTAMLMYGFVYYLTKKRWLGFLGGYALAFSPYVQSKIGGHPSYGFGLLLVAIFWLLTHALLRKSQKAAVLLGVVLAFCAYFDIYFVLLAITIVVPSIVAWLIWTVQEKGITLGAAILSRKRVACLVALACSITLMPIALVTIRDRSTIAETLGGLRGDTYSAAMMCSNKPLDYLLPDPGNYYLNRILGVRYMKENINLRNWCGFGESRVSISVVLIGLILLGAVLISWDYINRRSLTGYRIKQYPARFIIGALIFVLIAALLVGLPPKLLGITMPSGYILKVTGAWRIFAREYMVVNFAVVTLAMFVLLFISRAKLLKPPLKIIGFLVLLLAIGAEYQANPVFKPFTFSYSRDVPGIYRTIRDNQDVKAIAEYPIDKIGIEYDSTIFYVTMQTIHKKPLLNSVAPNDPQEALHASLKDLRDPQTIPALRSLGITHVVVHGESAEDVAAIPGLTVVASEKDPVYNLTMLRKDDNTSIVLAVINNGPASNDVLVIEDGYSPNLPLIQSPLDIQFEMLQGGSLRVRSLDREPLSGSLNICFSAKMSALSDSAHFSVTSQGATVYATKLSDSYTDIRFIAEANSTLVLTTDNGHNIRIDKLNAECR